MKNKKRILLFGSNGFIGQSVANLLSPDHEMLLAAKGGFGDTVEVDLTKEKDIEKVIKEFEPEVIINCAGIVENGPNAKFNVLFTKNIIKSVVNAKIKPKIIICGSASVYGIVKKTDLPLEESYPANPVNEYAKSKYEEEKIALTLSKRHNLEIVVARIFNPLGQEMRGRFLIANLLEQINEIQISKKDSIELNRKDSLRDYLDVKDIASAIKQIAEKSTNYDVYNVGSGRPTSNSKILDLILKEFKLENVKVQEIAKKPEPLFACQASIQRIKNDIGWEPVYNLEDTIKEIVRAKK